MRETRPGRYEEDYLGDGAYVYMSPAREVVLYTSNGVEETNQVVLEPAVLAAFERWMTRVGERLAAHDAAQTEPTAWRCREGGAC